MGMLHLTLLCPLVSQGQSTNVSQQRSRPGLMAQCSLYDVLPQWKLCAFILLKLNAKAFQTTGLFFRTLNTKCLLRCVRTRRELEVETDGQNGLSEKQIFTRQSWFFKFHLQTYRKYQLKPERVSNVRCQMFWSAPGTIGTFSGSSWSPSAYSDSNASWCKFCLFVCRKKHNLLLLVDYSPVKPETERDPLSHWGQHPLSIWKYV